MASRLSDLAQGFNTAVDAKTEAERDAAAEATASRETMAGARATERARVQQAKDELFTRLQQFGERIDALKVERHESGVLFASSDAALSFDDAEGELVITITGTGNPKDRLDLDADGTWILTWRGQHRVFFTYGLQELLIEVLNLPRPASAEADPGAPRIKRAPRIQSSIAPPRSSVKPKT